MVQGYKGEHMVVTRVCARLGQTFRGYELSASSKVSHLLVMINFFPPSSS